MLEVQDEKQFTQKNRYVKTPNRQKKTNNLIEKSVIDVAYRTSNFNKIPPIVGIILANKFGNTIMVLEYDSINLNNYRPIKSYISEDDKSLIEIDLLTMYFSSLRSFAGETNIKNLSHLEIHGSNIKVQIYFTFEYYMIIVLLNSNTDLNSKEKGDILNYFKEKFVKYEFEFKHFNVPKHRELIKMIEHNAKIWFKKLNRNYIQAYRERYLQKHEIIDDLSFGFDFIIQDELYGNLENIPEDIVKNISREIENKIQDKLFENLKEKITHKALLDNF